MVENINNMKLDIIALFRDNYLAKLHIRQMARMLEKSHVSLLPYLKELEKERVLISKEIGKNKEYSLNLNNNQVREFLALAEKKKSLELLNQEIFIRKIYEEFLKLDLNGTLVLFGSCASKTHTKESDIDLMYLGDLNEIKARKIKEIGVIYQKKMHFMHVPFNRFRIQLSKHDFLTKEIVKNHVILCNHDLFINEVWRHYLERKEE